MIPKKYILSLLLSFGIIFGVLGSNAIAVCDPCGDCEGYLEDIIGQVDIALERIDNAEIKLIPPVSVVDRIRARASLRLAKINITRALLKSRRCSLSDCLIFSPDSATSGEVAVFEKYNLDSDTVTLKEGLRKAKKILSKAILKIYVRKYSEALPLLGDATIILGAVTNADPCPIPEGS